VLVKMLSEKEGSAGAAAAAVMALDLLAASHEDACRVIASDGAIALLVQLLRGGNVATREASVRLLLKLCSADIKYVLTLVRTFAFFGHVEDRMSESGQWTKLYCALLGDGWVVGVGNS
jgi:hypothetical protein